MKPISCHTIADALVFGESPRWRDGCLWASDMFGGRIVRMNEAGAVETVLETEAPSGLGWLPDGRLVFVSMKSCELRSYDGTRVEPYADLSALCAGKSLNDMVIDARGRAYVGNTGCNLFEGLDPHPTNLVFVENGRPRTVADDLIFPNGMAITPDGCTLIVAETFAHRLTAFDIDPSGSLSRRRVFADLGERTPDGICLDEQGAVWVASSETGEFVRILEGGEITHRIDSDAPFAAACATGGADRKTLYMMATLSSPAEILSGRSRARIDAAPLEIPGAGLP
ncbi:MULTISPECIES: SMP-30/gluconolactonase/LRE family protein [Hyphococcus]|uniref:Gluconolactonase n=1 Tax=Hyphococcus luteus TaxID=2058213 RepID=A0A2S7K182_9PROT|nr:SMP-30/gluconolactonase/LRE family protein [Marinicaulis flavus]PQA86262.1 gluconolactonase [Marinicaulis flavus]